MANPTLAKQAIRDATDLCLRAAQLADQCAAYVALRDGEVARRRAALDATHAVVQRRDPQHEQMLKNARDLATGHNFVEALATLRAMLAMLTETARLCVVHDGQAQALNDLDTTVAGLTQYKPPTDDPVVGRDLRRISELQAKAWGLHLAGDLDPARKALDELDTKVQGAQLKSGIASGSTNVAQAKLDFVRLCDREGGAELLDEIVSGIGGRDPRPFVMAAMEARFKLGSASAPMNPAAGLGFVSGLPELKQIYKLMAAIPDKHTRENPRLKQVHRVSGTSAFNEYAGVLTLGDPFSTSPYALAADSPAGPVDADCRVPPGPVPAHFDWNVMHEVGHTLDDKKQFMNKRLGDPRFGGWEDHAGDLATVAGAAAGAFNAPGITAQVIASFLDAGTEPVPAPAGWNAVKQWAQWVRHDQNPWDYDAECNLDAAAGGLVIGGRVYHEAYPNHWCSYLASARRQRVSTYQFRYSGEWFCELYAAYKSGMLNAKHPARSWLSELFGDAPPR